MSRKTRSKRRERRAPHPLTFVRRSRGLPPHTVTVSIDGKEIQSLSAWAAGSGVHLSTVSKILSGDRIPNGRTLSRMAACIGVGPDRLLAWLDSRHGRDGDTILGACQG